MYDSLCVYGGGLSVCSSVSVYLCVRVQAHIYHSYWSEDNFRIRSLLLGSGD